MGLYTELYGISVKKFPASSLEAFSFTRQACSMHCIHCLFTSFSFDATAKKATVCPDARSKQSTCSHLYCSVDTPFPRRYDMCCNNCHGVLTLRTIGKYRACTRGTARVVVVIVMGAVTSGTCKPQTAVERARSPGGIT